jgi:TP901 family phage tail tape measure protein
MPLGTRDVLLIIRAKDQASRIIQGVGRSFASTDADARAAGASMMAQGAALVGMGVAIGAVGIAGLNALNGWRKAAVDYQQQAALTLTQVDQQGVSLQQIGQIGLDVAKQIPAPLEQLQGGLYDIFSSMDVSVADSKTILEGFAKSAVAGQVDVQSAGRETIAVMNAFGLSTGDLNRIQDVQFQLVRKGVGTYQQFSTSIGRAIPSAARAGQSFEGLAGVMAFLTRNGLSTSQAATSAARAFDNIANSKVASHFKDIGISVTDAQGRFRPMVDIAGELAQKLEPLTDAQKAKALDTLFKGGGNNIQARRFWDLAIRDFGSLNTLTGDMMNSSGALDSAYNIMFNQPATQSQLLKNNLDALRIELGEQLIPIFQSAVQWALKIVQHFAGMSDGSKKLFVQILAGVSAFLTIAGAAFVFVGAIRSIQGAIKMVGGLAEVVTNPWLLAIVALAAAAYLIYKNWDKIKPYWDDLWKKMQVAVEHVRDAVGPIIDYIANHWRGWLADAASYWNTAKKVFSDVVDVVVNIWDHLKAFGQWFWGIFGPGFQKVWAAIKRDTGPIVQDLIAIFKQFVQYNQDILHVVQTVWSAISPFIMPVVNFIKDVVVGTFQLLWEIIKDTSDDVLKIVTAVWDAITQVLASFIDFIRGFLDFITGVFTLNWGKAWDGIKEMFGAVFDAIFIILDSAMKVIEGLFGAGWDIVRNVFITVWDTIKNALSAVWDEIKAIAGTTWDLIRAAIIAPIDALKALLGLAWDGIKAAAGLVWDAIKASASIAWDAIKAAIMDPINTVATLLGNVWNGMKGAAETAWNAVKDVIGPIIDAIVAIIEKIMTAVDKVIGAMKKIGDIAFGAGTGPGTQGAFQQAADRGAFPHNAMGTPFFAGGWTTIDEKGTELIKLPRGSQIQNTQQTMRTLAGQQGRETQQIAMYIENAEFHDHVDVVAAQKAANSRMATMGVT